MNEFELIRRITDRAPASTRTLMSGVGDDCAVIDNGESDLLITTDALVENIHFKLSYTDERALGAKMLNVNTSDVAAMGGTPRFFLVAITVPPYFSPDRVAELYEGMYAAAAASGVELIGGDTTAGPVLTAAITVIGETAHGAAILRSGARPGDTIYVTGELGDAALGLACLDAGLAAPEADRFVSRYRLPEPRIAAGSWLAATGMVTSMIDISDGLLADVGHLASASQTGYEIMVDDIPRNEYLEKIARAAGIDHRRLILGGGDDYELAFTVDGSRLQEFESAIGRARLPFEHAVTRVGTMVADSSRCAALAADGHEIKVAARGYDHFAGGTTGP